MEQRDPRLRKIIHDVRNATKISKDDIHYIRKNTTNDEKMELIIAYNDILEWIQIMLEHDSSG